MKVTREEKAEHRRQIIVAAARLFRERGFDGIGLADLMKDVGLTHGGFYRHFSSKEELKALAIQEAMKENADRVERMMKASPDRPFEALVETYLGTRHHGRREAGCPLAALGSDLSREPESVRRVVTEGQERLLALIAGAVPGRTHAARRERALAVLAQLVGALILSRTVSDPERSAEILRASIDSTLSR